MDMFSLKNKKALVTGAAKGLGRGMAEGLLEAGAEVLFVDVSRNVENVAAEYITKGFPAKSFVLDVGDHKGLVTRFTDLLSVLGGRIDILVNGAGIQRKSPFLDFPMDYWNDVLNINLSSVFLLSRLSANEMIKSGGGRIINIASMNSFFGGIDVSAYAASKGGIALLTKAMSNELTGKGINVNAIAPGYMDTDMNQVIRNEKTSKPLMERLPKGRWGVPADVKGVAVFLSAPASEYISGAVIPVDGGFLAR
jgi:2-deoxy-D-gluconate 3-dehydrogenase